MLVLDAIACFQFEDLLHDLADGASLLLCRIYDCSLQNYYTLNVGSGLAHQERPRCLSHGLHGAQFYQGVDTHRTLLLPPAVRADLSVAGPDAVADLQGLNGPPTLLMVMVGGQHDATEQADSKD